MQIFCSATGLESKRKGVGQMIGAAVLGCGTVGSGVVRMLTENADLIARTSGQEVRLKYVADIRPVSLPEGVLPVKDIDAVLADAEVGVIIETIGGSRIAYEYTKKALEAGRSVVTSNKELVSAHGDELLAIAEKHGCRYLFEASVGGGVPVVRPLSFCLSGNHISRICGIVNGSTNYLLTRMEDLGIGFPIALEEAKRLGYVEADPAADVEGWDARRKLSILAHTCFGSALADEALIPATGISGITEADLALAHAAGATIKLIACGTVTENGWNGWVNPALVKQGHPLYAVRDVFNGIVASGDFVGDVMFYGRGAGSEATASACVGDVIEVARGLRGTERFATVPAFDPEGERPTRWFMRLPGNAAVPEGCEPVEAQGLRALITPELCASGAKALAASLGVDAALLRIL